MGQSLNCQSCYMPMDVEEKRGIETDGNKSDDYCVYCYQNGEFTATQTLEQAVETNIPFWKGEGESDDEAREKIMQVFPKLKRWHV